MEFDEEEIENYAGASSTPAYRYRECLKNHAVAIGGHAVDGCRDFMPGGEEGTLDALKCAACNCHRNFHRKVSTAGGALHHPTLPHYSPHTSGYLNVTPLLQRPLTLPSTSREDDDASNPSSSGGRSGGGGSSSKRFRTKFTQQQKERMLAFADGIGWRIQKQDEAALDQFCADINVTRQVFKVWMHNNKLTLGKKP